MLQDPNVERYVAEAIETLQKQINELKEELLKLNNKIK